ncbi:MAG TPA: aminopeptidase P family protein [Chloroflexota bacterium]|nr:aminopeptidase P family protein [Chloroflexota bacterium]
MDIPSRIRRVRAAVEQKELDGLLVSQPENRRYLSGFSGSAGYLLISQTETFLLSDFRYLTQGPQQAPEYEFIMVERGFPKKGLAPVLNRFSAKRIGFEAGDMTVSGHNAWLEGLKESGLSGVELVATDGLVEELRALKDEDELAIIAEAVRIVDDAFARFREVVKPGMTEREAAWRLEQFVREEGAEALSFPTILASGPNAAKPHHGVSDREIRAGEPIVCDFGAKYEGYCSDITRTICIGQPDGRFDEIYQLVLEAQLTAERQILPGIEAKQGDQYARDVIANAGYGDKFGHGLGHGVGLQVHEAPTMGPSGELELAPAMTVTVEPGVYLPEWGGVRIEDICFVRHNGLEVVNRASKDPFVR